MQAQLTVSNIAQTVEEQRSQGESARRALYEMVNRECNTLRDVFGGECRLVSLNLTSSVQQRHSGAGVVADQLITNANASYEVSSTGLTKP